MKRRAINDRIWARAFKAEALSQQDGKCRYCREPLTCKSATADHVTAQIFGGPTKRENIAAACWACNQLKGPLSHDEYMRLIKSPPHGMHFYVWLAWSRRKLWLRVERACKRIEGCVA